MQILLLQDLIDLLNRSHVKVLFLSPKLIGLAKQALELCPNLNQIWLLNDSYDQIIQNGQIGTLAELMNLGNTSIDVKASSAKDLATIIFTSGTTGKSRNANISDTVWNDNTCQTGTILEHVIHRLI